MTHRIFTGTLPDGQQVLVQIWDSAAEVAFRDETWHTWGVPSELTEQPA